MDLGKQSRCVTPIDHPPGDQLKEVRRRHAGLAGWLAGARFEYIRRIRPEVGLSSHIRGKKVAVDYLMQAFLRETCVTFILPVPDHRLAEFEGWKAQHLESGGSSVEVRSISGIVKNGLSEMAPDMWINLRGNDHIPSTLRNDTASPLFPIMSVQHGLSNHGQLYDEYLRMLLGTQYCFDSLICTSRPAAQALSKVLQRISESFNRQHNGNLEFEGRIDVIPLCIDTDLFRPGNKRELRKHLRIADNAVVMLYVGYVSQVKADLAPFLLILSNLRNDNRDRDVRFIIAGTGPDKYIEELEQLAAELGLVKSVIVMRDISDDTKIQLMQAADIFVAPCDSMQESFGLAPVEAMACGLPQVAADWSGYRETVVNNVTGFLIPTCWGYSDGEFVCSGELLGWSFDHIVQGQAVALDLTMMKECLQSLIRNEDLREEMSRCSRARALEKFSFSQIARCYCELWRDLTEVCGATSRKARVDRADRTSYFNDFGHFASLELADTTVVKAVSSYTMPLERMVRIAQTQCPGITVIDQVLLDVLLRAVTSRGKYPVASRIGELIAAVASPEWPPRMIRRHILFLLKHGKLSL